MRLVQLERPERGYCRDWQRGCLFVCHTVGVAGKRFCLRPWRDGNVLGVRSVRSSHAKDSCAGVGRLSSSFGARSMITAKSMPRTKGYVEAAFSRSTKRLSSGLIPAYVTRIGARAVRSWNR